MREDQERLQYQLEELVVAQEDVNAELELRLEWMLADLETANSEYQAIYGQWQIEEAERIRVAEEQRRQREAAERAAGGRGSPASGAAITSRPRAAPARWQDRTPSATPGWSPGPGVVSTTGWTWWLRRGPRWWPSRAGSSGVSAGTGPGGNDLYLKGNSGDLYYYAHLQGYAPGIAAGVAVGKGQVVGYNGATGNASVPHLHLGYQPGGGPLTNPYQLMVKLCR